MARKPAWQSWLMTQWLQPAPGWRVWPLMPLSWLYGALTATLRATYTLGLRHAVRPRCRVIVVGNLITGGAGKTPAVIAIVKWLRSQGHVPGVVSRGYGRTAHGLAFVNSTSPPEQVGDEPVLIHLRTGAPVVVAADRGMAAEELCSLHPSVNVIVSDDGLQHLRLARDIEILMFDERGAGNGWMLPAGPLRDALPQHCLHPGPVRQLVLYSTPRVTTHLTGYVGDRSLSGVIALSDWWRDPAAATLPLARLRGRRLLAVAGLARPEAFFAMLEAQGLAVVRHPLPDHHDFAQLPWPSDEADVIVTEKDAVKLRPERVGSTRVWVARLDFEPVAGFYAALAELLAETPLPPPP